MEPPGLESPMTTDTAQEESTPTKPFTTKGECNDEVTFLFDDGKELYASRNFLSYASPVMKSMFSPPWAENDAAVVKMPGKSYSEFLEFLLMLHPTEQIEITDDTVFSMKHLAEEYQVDACVLRCNKFLNELLQTVQGDELRKSRAVLTCFEVLTIARMYSNKDLAEAALSSISSIPFRVYTEEEPGQRGYWCDSYFSDTKWLNNTAAIMALRRKCREVFNALPGDLKITILQTRLLKKDDGKPK